MNTNMRHGVVLPSKRQAPARVVNVRSRRNKNQNTRIRLDRLLRAAKPKICIKRRLGGIGDVLMTTPLLKAIKTLIPRCHLVYATDTSYSDGALAQIIKHNPYVDELITNSEIQEGTYDYTVDITSTGLSRERSGTVPPNRIDMFADEVGVDVSSDPVPIYVVTKIERTRAQAELKRLTNGDPHAKIIAVQVRSNDARRTWPLNNMSKLIKLLSEEPNYHVLVFDWGNTVDRWEKTSDNIHLIMNRSLTDTAALTEQANLVVCPDSSMLHIAGALNKKTVSIFGPIPPDSRINHYANAIAVTNIVKCSFCWYSPRCMKNSDGKMECLTGISPEKVRDAVRKKLKSPLLAQKNITYGKDLTTKGQDPLILIRRTTNGLGDLLMTTPAIDALALKYPRKQIEVACQRNLWPALQNNPSISKLIDSSDRVNHKRYYAVIDVSMPCARYEAARVAAKKPVQKSRVEIFAEAMGVRDSITSLKPRYYIRDSEKEWAKEFLKKTIHSNKPKIAIGLRSAEIYRNWPEKHYTELFNKLRSDFEIILLDHSREHIYKDIIDACGFPLRKSLAVMEQCDGLITVDTGLLHFGAALDIPTVALFGPIDSKARCKGYDKVTVIKFDRDCVPCWRNGSMPCEATGRVKGYSKCLESISAKTVAEIAIRKFSKV